MPQGEILIKVPLVFDLDKRRCTYLLYGIRRKCELKTLKKQEKTLKVGVVNLEFNMFGVLLCLVFPTHGVTGFG